jgi:signal peptidase II
MTDRNRRLCGYLTALGVLLIDQLTKRIAYAGLELHQPVPVLGDLLRFTLAWNQGAAFSMPWGGPLFLAVITAAAAVLVAVFIWKVKEHSTLFLAGLGAILGGALGNLMDRLMYGRVVDFIDIGTTGWRWPVFNAADIAITFGGIILVILYRKETSSGEGDREDSDGGN